jgi:hypothetical protein
MTMLMSLTQSHQRRCRSSQLFDRSSWTVHALPCACRSSGVCRGSRALLKKPQSPWSSSTTTFERRAGSMTGFGSSFRSTDNLIFLFNPVRRIAEMPLAGLPSLRAGRAVEDEKPAVCEALENAGIRNPGGNVVERWVVADTRPPNMLRLEQCIVCSVDCVVPSRLLGSHQEINSRESGGEMRPDLQVEITLTLRFAVCSERRDGHDVPTAKVVSPEGVVRAVQMIGMQATYKMLRCGNMSFSVCRINMSTRASPATEASIRIGS